MRESSLAEIRDEISRMDRELIELLTCRLKRTLDVETLKRALGRPIHSPDREQKELAMVLEYARTLEPSLPKEFLIQLMTLIFKVSVAQQELQRVQAIEHAQTG